ncbi:hypothetical protein O5466_23885 [Escherichia coli]|nr:hypothetical protein [Escherichia coli]
MAERGYGLAGLGIGKVKSVNQYRLTPGFGGFTPVPYVITECRLTCRWRGIKESPNNGEIAFDQNDNASVASCVPFQAQTKFNVSLTTKKSDELITCGIKII